MNIPNSSINTPKPNNETSVPVVSQTQENSDRLSTYNNDQSQEQSQYDIIDYYDDDDEFAHRSPIQMQTI